MNKETIEKAAWDYAEGIPQNEDRKKYSWEDFKAGAEWRINSVWHDRSEKYEIRLPSVIVFKNRKVAIYPDLRDVTYDGLWDDVKEYAYLKDLLPDRKEDAR